MIQSYGEDLAIKSTFQFFSWPFSPAYTLVMGTTLFPRATVPHFSL